MDLDRAFLTAIYHDALDDARYLANGLVRPISARFADLDALLVALLSPRGTSKDTTRWLLDVGCDPFVENGDGVCAALVACAGETTSREIVDALVAASRNDVTKQAALVRYCVTFRRRDILDALRPHAVDEDVLRRIAHAHCALELGMDGWSAKEVRLIAMCDRGTNSRAGAPIHAAAFAGNREPFLLLPDLVNARDALHRTPLMYAIDGRRPVEFIRFLCRDVGADVNATSEHGGAVLEYACRSGSSALVEEILRAPGFRIESAPFALHSSFAFFDGDMCAIELLIEAGYDVVAPSSRHGWPAVFYLADVIARDKARQPGRGDVMQKRLELVPFAIAAHARAGDEDVRCASGQTLLMLACALDVAELARCALDLHPSPKKLAALVDSKGRTAYHWACARCSRDAIKCLQEYGLLDRAALAAVDADGATGADLLADEVLSTAKHREWPTPLSAAEALGLDRDADVAADVAASHARCVAAFDVDAGLTRKPGTCAACYGLTITPKRCARCKIEVYCSLACQRLAWPEHRAACEDASPTLADVLARTPTA